MLKKIIHTQLKLFGTVSFILVIAVLLSACGSNQGTATATATAASTGTSTQAPTSKATGTQQGGIPVTGNTAQTVKVTEKDYNITLSPNVVSPGEITFQLTNQGPSEHEFIIFKTNLAEDKLPTTSEAKVDESSSKLNKIYEQQQYPANTSKTAKVKLDAGHYVIICNLPGHYLQGMHASLTVTENAAPTQTALAKTPSATAKPKGTPTAKATPTGEPVASVQVIEKDFEIFIDKESVPAGKIQFQLRNEGVSDQDFMILKTDLSPDNLPVKNAQVNEKADSIQKIASKDKLPPGETHTLMATLAPGHYVLISNLEGHYQKGMHVALTVTASQQGGSQGSQNGTPAPNSSGTPAATPSKTQAAPSGNPTGTPSGMPTTQTGTPAPSSGSATKVEVVEKSYAILMSKSMIPAGKVEFDLSNMADIQHEFVIFKTDLAGDNLPVSNGQVDEKSSELTKIDEQDKYPAGETRTLTVDLDPGHYVAICNLPGHYQQGMYFEFTVGSNSQ